ncbi:MAG: hypothetical protein ACYDGM_05400 [Vulcanimicrobiaceae bacterium]
MAQRNLAFITGHAPGGKTLEAGLIAQVEHFVGMGRRNIVVVMDTFPNVEEATIAALLRLLHRASELEAQLTCVALDERTVTALRTRPMLESLRIIRNVDQIPGAA